MARGAEGLSCFLAVDAFDECGEKEDHISTFVHDGRSAVSAADFAGKVVGNVFVRGIVPAEIVMAVGEVDVRFVEDTRPLEWRLQRLAAVRDGLTGPTP